MPTFHDEKKNKTFTLAKSDLVDQSRVLASGATIAIQPNLVNWNEVSQVIGMRAEPRNTGAGIVLTRPDSNHFFVETVWIDHGDNDQPDGDITLFTESSPDNFEVIRMKIKEMLKKYPAWGGYHHGNKDYLK